MSKLCDSIRSRNNDFSIRSVSHSAMGDDIEVITDHLHRAVAHGHMPSAGVSTAENLIFKPWRVLGGGQKGDAARIVIESDEEAVIVVRLAVQVVVGVQKPFANHICVRSSICNR